MAELNLAHSLAENTTEAYRITECGRCAQCLMMSVAGVSGCVAACDTARVSWWNDPCCTRSVLHWWGSTSGADTKVSSPPRPRSGGSLTADETAADFKAYTPATKSIEADTPGSGVSLNTMDGGSEGLPTPGGSAASLAHIATSSGGGGDAVMAEAGGSPGGAEGETPRRAGLAEPETPPKESE